MNLKSKAAIFAAFCLLSICSLVFSEGKKEEPAVIALVGGTLLDGSGGSSLPNAVIVIEGNKIKSVGPASAVKIPDKARKIDVSGKWVLPGFIDCHIHTTYPYNETEYFTDTESLATLRALHIMDMYLKSGVTSVRDAGSPVASMQALRTDAVGPFMKLYPGIYFTELRYFVEMGASPLEAIVAATKNGALILGKGDELGTIEPGKLADIQVVKTDPLKSLDSLGKPDIVIVNGKVHLLGG